MSNNNSGPTGPSDPNAANNIGATGSNGGTITISGSTITAGNWISYTIPCGAWGYISLGDLKEKKKNDRDGCDCKKCKEFYPYAEPNQEDGTLICYKCRHGW